MLRGTGLLAVAAMTSAIHLGGSPHTGLPAATVQPVSGQSQPLTRTVLRLKPATELEHLRGGATAHAAPAAQAPAVISSVDVASVASLEEAAKKVKLLTEFTGAHELKVSVKDLTEQVQTLTKQHSALMAAVGKMKREQCMLQKEKMSADTRASALLRRSLQAQVHRDMFKKMKGKGAHGAEPDRE